MNPEDTKTSPSPDSETSTLADKMAFPLGVAPDGHFYTEQEVEDMLRMLDKYAEQP